MRYNSYHANHGRIGNREVFRRSSRITVNTVTFSNFERFVQGQYTLAENCFSRNVMYIPPMSDSSLWLLSKALDFWEIVILKLVVSMGKWSAASEVYMWKMFLCHLGSIVDGWVNMSY